MRLLSLGAVAPLIIKKCGAKSKETGVDFLILRPRHSPKHLTIIGPGSLGRPVGLVQPFRVLLFPP